MRTLLIAPLMLLATLCASVIPLLAPSGRPPQRRQCGTTGVEIAARMIRAGEVAVSCLQTVHHGSRLLVSGRIGTGRRAYEHNSRSGRRSCSLFRREPDWLALSGIKGNKIFYRKAVIACGGKVWHAHCLRVSRGAEATDGHFCEPRIAEHRSRRIR